MYTWCLRLWNMCLYVKTPNATLSFPSSLISRWPIWNKDMDENNVIMGNDSRLDVADHHLQHEVHGSDDGFHLLDHTWKEDTAWSQRHEVGSTQVPTEAQFGRSSFYLWSSPGELAFEPQKRTGHQRRGFWRRCRFCGAEERLWMAYLSAGKLYLREEALALVFPKWKLKQTFWLCRFSPSGWMKSLKVGRDRQM